VLSDLDFDERLCGRALGETPDFVSGSRRWTLSRRPRRVATIARRGRPAGTDDFRAMSIFNESCSSATSRAESPRRRLRVGDARRI
jgi:hypothetical protein